MKSYSIAVLVCLTFGLIASGADIVVTPGDSMSQVQAKVNGYKANDTLTFNGSRVISSVISFPNNGTLTVTSTPGTVLQATHHSFVFFVKGCRGITFINNDLSGGGWYLQDSSFISITRNKLHDINNNGNNAQHGIYHLNLADSWIVNNDIYNIRGPGADTGVFGFGRKRSKVNFNRILNVHEGIHDFYYDRDNQRGDNEVIGNLILGTDRHSIEQQYCANGLKVQYNWVGKRQPGDQDNGMGDSNATGGVPGDPPGQSASWNVDVSYNVFDFRGNTESDWSQNACVEAMRNIDVHHNWFVGNNTGKMQGILHSQNSPGWTSRENLFQNISNWYSGGSGSPVIAPIKTNDRAFTGEPPTYEQLVAMAGGAAPPPPPPPSTQPAPAPLAPPIVKAFKTKVQVSHPDPAATFKKFDGENKEWPVTIVGGYDTAFSADQVDHHWRFGYEARKGSAVSARVSVQIGSGEDPGGPPPPPPPPPPATQPTEYIFPIPGGFELVFPLNADHSVGALKWRKAA